MAAKRPGILAWIGFGLVAASFLVVIVTIFSGIKPRSAKYPERLAFESATITPSPAPMLRKAGSAAADLEGKKIEPRIIKNGELSLRVTDASKAIENIRALVGAKNGFVESSSLSDPGTGPRSAWMTLRIPVDRFDETMNEVKRMAVLVLNESVRGQDVTTEFVDLEADLRNARAEEQSYLEILKRSGSIEEVLAVTERLADVRGRIERFEGRKRYLENLTDLATIAISLTEETRIEVPSRTWKPLEVLRQAFRDLVESLQALVDFLIRLIVAVIGLLLPVVAIVALIIWLGWKIIKKLHAAFTRKKD